MEYQITWLSSDAIGQHKSEELNAESAAGWELVGVVPFNDGAKIFWKRAIKVPEKQPQGGTGGALDNNTLQK